MTIEFFNVLFIINTILIDILAVVFFNQGLHMILSFVLPPLKYKDTAINKTYGFLIAARNEKDNIVNIVESIKAQNYDKDKIKIFVVADNCKDNTAELARKAGAIVFERFNLQEIGKSYALEYAFEEIYKDENNNDIDAFFIFDADNILDKDYTKEMNKAFVSGKEIITSCRLSKNFSDSWLAGTSSFMFLREDRQIHNNRSRLNIGTYVSGTGYLISARLIKEFKYWPFHTMTEDIELSAYVASRGIKIAYCSKARFYDEQPISLKQFWIQRMRWCKGTHQVFFKEGGHLLLGFFKKQPLSAWGMFVHTIPLPAISFMWFCIYLIMGFVYFLIAKVPYEIYWTECLKQCISNFIYPVFIGEIAAIVLVIECWKWIDAKWYKKILYAILFPFGMMLFLPITVCALFKRKIKWKPTNNIK